MRKAAGENDIRGGGMEEKKRKTGFRTLLVVLTIAFSLPLISCGGGGAGDESSSSGGGSSTPTPSPTPSPSSPPAYQTPYPFVEVLHTVAVFDNSRRLLYAYVPPGDTDHPQSIAMIDVDQKTVKYSAPVDFVTRTMSVSPDGRYLYVATIDTGEVIRLSLPDLTVDVRFGLGTDPAFPSDQLVAEGIAVLPSDSTIFAVSLVNMSFSPSCAAGVRVYQGSDVLAEVYNNVNTCLGATVSSDLVDGQFVTVSKTYPDIVTRLAYSGNSLSIIDSQRGAKGPAHSLDVRSNMILTGTGSIFGLPNFTLKNAVVAMTYYEFGIEISFDPAPSLGSCVFADDNGAHVTCLSATLQSATSEFPTDRAIIFYQVSDGMPVAAIPMDVPMNVMSRIFKTGTDSFVVSIGDNDQNRYVYNQYFYLHQNSRIYFIF